MLWHRVLAGWVLAMGLGGWGLAAGGSGLTVMERMEVGRMEAAAESVKALAAGRVPVLEHGLYEDYRVAFGVRVKAGVGRSREREVVWEAAREAGIHAVVWDDAGAPAEDAWRGLRDGVLGIVGMTPEEGVFILPEYGEDGRLRAEGGLRFATRMGTEGERLGRDVVGLAVVNRAEEMRMEVRSYLGFLNAQAEPRAWAEVTNAFLQYPDVWMAAACEYRPAVLGAWDRETAEGELVGVGWVGGIGTQAYRGVTFDPAGPGLRQVTTHVWARELREGSIKEGLREGRAYVAHDWMADPTGFHFGAVNNLGVFPMGDRVPWAGKTRVVALSPVAARWRLLHGGKVVAEATGTRLEHVVEGLGAYRVEGWLKVGGEERPWLYSNPVYVELPSPALLSLPSSELAPEVRAVKDVVYREGSEEDAAKHRLDLYLPRDKEGFPVVLFAHGGAWKHGDRSQYPAIGNRFAKEGIGFVVPSYRLAPKHPHPAQIEDVAAAFAWTAREVAKFGGDSRRLYVAGHSAGGHLVSLLALDPRWLGAHGLTPASIRGVMTLSGVYDLSVAEVADSVFSKDPVRRREASPQAHVARGAPRFLVTYCEWDYLLLPAQARGFHRALGRAGVEADLVYVAGQNHISEMVNVAREGDKTAAAMLRFIR